jgi:hypothetical protein
MRTTAINLLRALGLAAVLAAAAAGAALAQPSDPDCVPQYDSSGAQTAPYCH